MYVDVMSAKIDWPSRMSLPLSPDERDIIIDLKAVLQKRHCTLKDFVWEAIVERMKRDNLLPLAEKAKKK